VRSLPALVVVAALAISGCSGAPSQEEERAAGMALAATRMTGQSLGRCLAAAGYDVDAATVAGNVQRGTDVQLTSGPQKAYLVRIEGPKDVTLTVVYDKAWVEANDESDEAALAEVHCSL